MKFQSNFNWSWKSSGPWFTFRSEDILTSLNVDAGRVYQDDLRSEHRAAVLRPNDPDLGVRLQLLSAEGIAEAPDGPDGLRFVAVLGQDERLVAVATLNL